MKIDDKLLNYEVSKYASQTSQNASNKVEEKRVAENQKVEETNRAEGDAIVSLSQASKEAQQIQAAVKNEPDVRAEKVAALREEIESGRYKIDNEAVANKLVDSFIDEIV